MAATPEKRRELYWRDPEKNRERQRAYRAENSEKINAKIRERRAADPEKSRRLARERYARDSERILAREKARRDRNPYEWLKKNHRIDLAEWRSMWDMQSGKCYLCSESLAPLPGRNAVIDHDHRCPKCGDKNKSCDGCRRGISCQRCNLIIGWVDDDPALLIRISMMMTRRSGDWLTHAALRPEMMKLGAES